MVQLIIVILSIALTSLMTVAMVDYLPAGPEASPAQVRTLTNAGINLEEAYYYATKANGGVAPAPTTAVDGGLMANFGALLTFAPAPLPGFTWSYGQHPNDGSAYANMDYFCMQPLTNANGNRYALLSAKQAGAAFSSSQYLLAGSCGAVANAASATPAQLFLTLYVAYNPNIAPPA